MRTQEEARAQVIRVKKVVKVESFMLLVKFEIGSDRWRCKVDELLVLIGRSLTINSERSTMPPPRMAKIR